MGDLGIEEPRVRPHHRRPEPLGESGDGPADQSWSLRARIGAAVTEVCGEGDTGFGPDHRMRSPDALTGVVVRDALLAGPVDLDIGRVQIQRRAHASQRLAALGIERCEPAAHQRGVRGLDPGEDLFVEALGERDERRRRRDVGHRPQPTPRYIDPLVVQVNHEVPARKHHLRGRQHQATRPQTLPADLDRPHPGIDLGTDPQHPVSLRDQHQTRLRGQLGVVISNHHPSSTTGC